MKIDLPYFYSYDKRRAADHKKSISLCWARATIENGMTGTLTFLWLILFFLRY